jgi:hypothetical protein
MIETIIKPRPLDNDVGVIKVLQLMGQLSLKDIQYVLNVTLRIYERAQHK